MVENRRAVYGVLSAFPAELEAVLDRVAVSGAIAIGERTFRTGELGGVSVVVGMTGIGLENATATTRALLERGGIDGIVVSGVAGSPLRIGDVVVAETWAIPGQTAFAADPTWIELARTLVGASDVELDRCGERADIQPSDTVCLPHEPEVVVGGTGESSDPFGGKPVACQPDGGDVFGCDPPAVTAGVVPGAAAPVAVDMETAAIAAEAAARELPFIAFRAVSDGTGDPLNLPGFPAQFFAYYPLAASNAAIATSVFLERLAETEARLSGSR
jgi:nucleoside phosphorylase